MKKLYKKLICFLKGHRWTTHITSDHDYVIQDGEQLYLVSLQCRRCKKKSEIQHLILKQSTH